MSHYTKSLADANDRFVHQYNGISQSDLAGAADQQLTAAGYKLKSGEPGNGVYEKGNRVMRILFGAFVKYNKFNVATKDGEEGPQLNVNRATSGFSGGIIGMSQVRKETKRMSQVMKGL